MKFSIFPLKLTLFKAVFYTFFFGTFTFLVKDYSFEEIVYTIGLIVAVLQTLAILSYFFLPGYKYYPTKSAVSDVFSFCLVLNLMIFIIFFMVLKIVGLLLFVGIISLACSVIFYFIAKFLEDFKMRFPF